LKNEIYTAAASFYGDCVPPYPNGQCNLEWWEVWANHITDPWLKEFYEDELGIDWKIEPGQYKATIDFSAPGVTNFHHTQIFVKPQN